MRKKINRNDKGYRSSAMLSDYRVLLMLLIAGMAVRIVYILGTDITERQHDVYSFEEMKGHAGYIGYLLENFKLPDFDPRSVFQFYHPPLHHSLAALWMRANLSLGIEFSQAAENIQILTLLYSGAFLMITGRIFMKLGLSGKGLAAAFALIAFNPALIILSGSINNDMLSILLMQGAFLFALRWSDRRRIADIAVSALFLGLGMMTKLSVGIAAGGIGFIFIIKFLQDKDKRSKMLAGFAVFAAICFPLALWWGIRNAVLFGVPVGYVPSLGDASHQYIGNYPVFERLFDFSLYQFKNVYVAWGEPYFEHNVFIGLLKTATFGEQTLSEPKGFIYTSAQILFAVSVLIALIAAFYGAKTLFGKKTISDKLHKGFLLVVFLTFMAAYIQFCFAYPHTCTQNIRYATPLVWIAAFSIGKGIGHSNKTGTAVIILTGIFALASAVFYTTLSFQ